jgi:peptidoglycan/LPS O-acetylase OafA/YrhL
MLFLDAGQNYRKYGPQATTHDLYKFFAILLMVVDHVGFVFFPQEMWWRAVGRLCVPVWLFLAGYARPAHVQREFFWLSGLLVLTDWYVGEPILPLNIFVTIIISRLFVAYADMLRQNAAALATLVAIAFVFLPSAFFAFEYGSQAFLLALAGYYYRNYPERGLAPVSLVIAWAVFAVMQAVSFVFTPVQIAFVAVGCALVCMALTGYRIQPLAHSGGKLWVAPVKFIARNSHYVYALHLVVFLLIRKWMQSGADMPIRWL